MGFGGISIWQLLIILVIVVLVFGTGKLKNIGSDLGGAVRNFRKSMKEGEDEQSDIQNTSDEQRESLENRQQDDDQK